MTVSTAPPEALSPELVLVDPGLALEARACLPDPEDSIAAPAPPPIAWSEQQTAEALRRLSLLDEEDARVERGRPRFRIAKLTAALATWATVAILAAGTQPWSAAPL